MTEAIVSKIGELQAYDKVLAGSLLGPVTAAETLTVKTIRPADNDRCAVTFVRVGTLYLHKDQMVEALPRRGGYVADDSDLIHDE